MKKRTLLDLGARALAVLAVVTTIGSAQATTTPGPVTAPAPSPFAFADWSWLNGNPRTSTPVLETAAFTGEFRLDVQYVYDWNRPKDHTLVGTSESGRTNEVQLQQLGVGGDFHWQHVRGRVMTQFGMYSTMTPRNDASPGRGQWNLADAYRYLSEAYGGYHWDRLHGINLDAGVFMSYVGLFSYYNFDNWAYQPSYVSSNTPWFFNGVRLQVFATERLKIEPWLVNGWQSYGIFNEAPGAGLQLLYRPNARVSLLTNNYVGADWLGLPGRRRVHTDNSVQFKYRDDSTHVFSRGAVSLTVDAGCERGAGAACRAQSEGEPLSQFFGWMLYDRMWFSRNRVGLTLGGGMMNNPGRYLVLMPPINGATAFSGTPYFSANPGDPFRAWDVSATLDLMPDPWTTFRVEVTHRAASVPYFAGRGGVTPPGGNQGSPGSLVPGWTPDLRRAETRLLASLLIKL
ncbi:MAG: outer membrane beta-barrel protein [Gemmatimonadaceae bacterium]|jgi:hypothetical protein